MQISFGRRITVKYIMVYEHDSMSLPVKLQQILLIELGTNSINCDSKLY